MRGAPVCQTCHSVTTLKNGKCKHCGGPLKGAVALVEDEHDEDEHEDEQEDEQEDEPEDE